MQKIAELVGTQISLLSRNLHPGHWTVNSEWVFKSMGSEADIKTEGSDGREEPASEQARKSRFRVKTEAEPGMTCFLSRAVLCSAT